MTESRLDQALHRLKACNPVEISKRPAATIWKVTLKEETAALKLYTGESAGNEAAAALWLRSFASKHVVRVIDATPDSLATQWLDGPSLGDLSRAGRDAEACTRLVRLASKIHAKSPEIDGLPQLRHWLDALWTLRAAAGCPPGLRRDIARAQALARDLITTAPPPVALHGDLHHDNVIATPRGDIAFDPKGMLGDPGYELANAFRNPKGVDPILRDPARIAALADQIEARLGIARPRILAWAAVKSALSIAWRSKGPLHTDPEADLLARLLATTQSLP